MKGKQKPKSAIARTRLLVNVLQDDSSNLPLKEQLDDVFKRIFVDIPKISLQMIDLVEREIPAEMEFAKKNPQHFRLNLKTVDMKKYPLGIKPFTPEQEAIPVKMNIHELATTCLYHLTTPGHICAWGNHFLEDVKPSCNELTHLDERLSALVEKCRNVHKAIQEQMIKVRLGLSLLFPKYQNSEGKQRENVLKSLVNSTDIDVFEQQMHANRHEAFRHARSSPHLELNAFEMQHFYLHTLRDLETSIRDVLYNTTVMHHTVFKNLQHLFGIADMKDTYETLYS